MIKLVEYYEDSSASQMYLILEYYSGGELFDQLKAQPHDKFPEATAAVLVHQMVSAVAYCHKMGIAHRDLKLENFLFEKPWVGGAANPPCLKLIGEGSMFFLQGCLIAMMQRHHTAMVLRQPH